MSCISVLCQLYYRNSNYSVCLYVCLLPVNREEFPSIETLVNYYYNYMYIEWFTILVLLLSNT